MGTSIKGSWSIGNKYPYDERFDNPRDPPKEVAILEGISNGCRNHWSFWVFPRVLQDEYWSLKTFDDKAEWLGKNGRQVEPPLIYVSDIIGNPVKFQQSVDEVEVRKI